MTGVYQVRRSRLGRSPAIQQPVNRIENSKLFYAFKNTREAGLLIMGVSGLTPGELADLEAHGWTIYRTTDKTAIQDAHQLFRDGVTAAL